MTGFFKAWRQDLPASIVVALVALPLCLGIALASGAPLFSGLIAGVAGGIVVGLFSRSQLSVSGPAAGLTVIVLGAIQAVPAFDVFLLAVVLAGIMKVGLSFTRSGVLGEFVPSSVITGMLAAIGLILILKQIPHAIGYDGEYEGSFEFLQADGLNTLTAIVSAVQTSLNPAATLIAVASIAFLFWWDKAQPRQGPLRLVPGPLVVVLFGVALNAAFAAVAPELALSGDHLVQIPVPADVQAFFGLFTLPDFSAITMPVVWTTAATLAIVASLESLLSVKAVDALDPMRRTTDKDSELLAQGAGNIASGMIGGLPVTSVIVRSSANVSAGAVSNASAVMHGVWLLLSVAAIPMVLNLIPLSALAAVLIATGYKLTKPQLFVKRWHQGWQQFVPFVATVAAILFTDLLIGVLIGLGIGFAFVIARNFRPAVTFVRDGSDVMIRARRNLYFIHKHELQTAFGKVPDNATVIVDLSAAEFVDPDNVEIINNFARQAEFRGIEMIVRDELGAQTAPQIEAPIRKVAYA